LPMELVELLVSLNRLNLTELKLVLRFAEWLKEQGKSGVAD